MGFVGLRRWRCGFLYLDFGRRPFFLHERGRWSAKYGGLASDNVATYQRVTYTNFPSMTQGPWLPNLFAAKLRRHGSARPSNVMESDAWRIKTVTALPAPCPLEASLRQPAASLQIALPSAAQHLAHM